MWLREHDGKVMSIGECVDHLTNGARADLFGGGAGESMTLGQSIDAEIRGYQEECWRLSDAVMLGRRVAEAVIALGDERLPLAPARELVETTEQWVEGTGPTLAEAGELAKSKGITLGEAAELIKGQTA
jgi:hypothetical protein